MKYRGEFMMTAGAGVDFVDSNVEESMLAHSKSGNAFDRFIVE